MQNDMRDRLIKLIKKVPYGVSVGATFEQHFCEKIADHLISNGVILPPCKIGDTVYQPSYKFTKCSANDYTPTCYDDIMCFGCESACDSVEKPYIYKGEVKSIEIKERQIYLKVRFEEKIDLSTFILGKTVFLTREEAEEKLEEMKNG